MATACFAAEEEGEVAADEGAEDHDAAADDGEVCLTTMREVEVGTSQEVSVLLRMAM